MRGRRVSLATLTAILSAIVAGSVGASPSGLGGGGFAAGGDLSGSSSAQQLVKINGAPLSAALVNLTGTDSINVGAGQFQKFVLNGQNESSLTLTASGFAAAPSTSNYYRFRLEFCQDATGSRSMPTAWTAGGGVTNIYWSAGNTTPALTAVAGYCDIYDGFYDGTNVQLAVLATYVHS
jgi:hypothetical protein